MYEGCRREDEMAWQGTSAPGNEIRLGPVLVNGGAGRERVVVLLEACCLLMVENSSREDLKLLRLPALARSCRLFWRHCSELWPPTRQSRIKACQGVSRAVIAVIPLLILLKMVFEQINNSLLLLHETIPRRASFLGAPSRRQICGSRGCV